MKEGPLKVAVLVAFSLGHLQSSLSASVSPTRVLSNLLPGVLLLGAAGSLALYRLISSACLL